MYGRAAIQKHSPKGGAGRGLLPLRGRATARPYKDGRFFADNHKKQ